MCPPVVLRTRSYRAESGARQQCNPPPVYREAHREPQFCTLCRPSASANSSPLSPSSDACPRHQCSSPGFFDPRPGCAGSGLKVAGTSVDHCAHFLPDRGVHVVHLVRECGVLFGLGDTVLVVRDELRGQPGFRARRLRRRRRRHTVL